jgi:hypothetical protein
MVSERNGERVTVEVLERDGHGVKEGRLWC